MHMHTSVYVLYCVYSHSYVVNVCMLLNLSYPPPQVPRTEWVLKWPGQVVIAGCQTCWTAEVSAALDEDNLPELYQKMLGQVLAVSVDDPLPNAIVGLV